MKQQIPFSILDLAPILKDSTAAQAFLNTLDLARHAEKWGYKRYWLAEHHSMPGIASAATAVVIGYVAGGTSTIRVGAGGIMLPNHAPLVIAEQFGTLESLYPGRIDLGLGMTGMTAWVGLNLVEVKAGDVIYISGAAGAVGNVAGQLAKLRGCKVIGSAGSMEKVKFLRDECDFDIAFDYKTGPVVEQLKVEAPDGIDVYFDNVGGEALEAALSMLRVHGRIIACGGISGYNEEKPRPGPSNLFNITTKRLTMRGMIVSDSLDRRGEFEKEVGGYLQSEKLKSKETVVEGLDQAEGALIGLFTGNNIGKMVVKLP